MKSQGSRISKLEDSSKQTDERLGKLEGCVQTSFNPENTIVALNVPKFTNENPTHLAKRIIDSTGSDRARQVVNAMHTNSHNSSKPGVFKIEMATLEDKIDVLRNKKNLKSSQYFRKVFLRSSQTHVERLMHLNFKTVLQEIPNGNEFRVSGNGRLIKQLKGRQQSQIHRCQAG